MSANEKQLIEKLIDMYVPLFSEDFPVIFFWIPKSGCTTLNKWFFFQLGLTEDVQQKTNGEVHGYRNLYFTNTPDYKKRLREHLQEGKKETYKLIRNPYKRAVSSFYSVICSPWLSSLLNVDLNKGLSFTQFLYYLKNLGPNIDIIDRHIGPQYIEGEENYVKKYIKLESFNKQIREIEDLHHLKRAPLAEFSKSPHHFSELMVKQGEYADMILKRDTFNWYFPTYESLYNQETQELVEEIFKKDFEIYVNN